MQLIDPDGGMRVESSQMGYGAASPGDAKPKTFVGPWARLSIGVRLVLIATLPQLLYTNVMTWLGSKTLREAHVRLEHELVQYPAAIAALKEIYSEDQKLMYVLVSLGLGFGAAFAAWYVAGRVRDGLLAVRRAALRIASGDLTTEVGLAGKSEIGKLAEALEQMRRGLAHRIELEAQAAEIEKDLALAETVESLFMPHEHGVDVQHARVTAVHRAAARVSGDFWHAERLDDGSLWIVLGDVAGSGPGPAMMAAAVLTQLRVLRRAGVHEPRALCRGVHDLVAKTGGERHTTALCLVNVPATGPVRYVCAGALAPVLRRRSGEVSIGEAGGRALSTDPLDVSSHEVHLRPGDRLALSTSGIAQLDPGAQAVTAVKVLMATHGHKGTPQICQQVEALIAGRRTLAEDVTLLVLERPEAADAA